MPRPTLSNATIKSIHEIIDKMYDKIRLRVTGYMPKTISIRNYIPELTMKGIFDAVNREERNVPNQDLINSLISIAQTYVDSQRENTKAQVIANLDTLLQESALKGIKTSPESAINSQLTDVWKKTTENLKRIVDTEVNTVKNVGALDSIVKINLSMGVEDPVVAMIGPIDDKTCDVCKDLYLQNDGLTPKVYKLSECTQGYYKRGSNIPSLLGSHPSCRHSLVTLVSGYGFKNGKLSYIGSEHNEYENQRK